MWGELLVKRSGKRCKTRKPYVEVKVTVEEGWGETEKCSEWRIKPAKSYNQPKGAGGRMLRTCRENESVGYPKWRME